MELLLILLRSPLHSLLVLFFELLLENRLKELVSEVEALLGSYNASDD